MNTIIEMGITRTDTPYSIQGSTSNGAEFNDPTAGSPTVTLLRLLLPLSNLVQIPYGRNNEKIRLFSPKKNPAHHSETLFILNNVAEPAYAS
jgi:hypothetical protein